VALVEGQVEERGAVVVHRGHLPAGAAQAQAVQDSATLDPGTIREVGAVQAQDVEDDVRHRLALRHRDRGGAVLDVDPVREGGELALPAVQHADLPVEEEVVVLDGQARELGEAVRGGLAPIAWSAAAARRGRPRAPACRPHLISCTHSAPTGG
jgi:hypothetical protein